MIQSHDLAALLELRARLQRLAFIAAVYGEDLYGYDRSPRQLGLRRLPVIDVDRYRPPIVVIR